MNAFKLINLKPGTFFSLILFNLHFYLEKKYLEIFFLILPPSKSKSWECCFIFKGRIRFACL